MSRDTAILSLRYPISRDTFWRRLALPKNGAITPPWYLVSHRHICAIPHFATYCAIIVRYPIKTSTKEFCNTIATSIARYEKYRCWASKLEALAGFKKITWKVSICHFCPYPLQRNYQCELWDHCFRHCPQSCEGSGREALGPRWQHIQTLDPRQRVDPRALSLHHLEFEAGFSIKGGDLRSSVFAALGEAPKNSGGSEVSLLPLESRNNSLTRTVQWKQGGKQGHFAAQPTSERLDIRKSGCNLGQGY